MQKFIASFRLPFITAFILAAGTLAAYVSLKPTGMDISNTEMVRIFQNAGWAVGPVFALLSLLLVGIFNLLRQLLRIRDVFVLHAPIVLLSVLPWLVLSWSLSGEPRYMNIAKALIDFVGRPLLWGSLAACAFALLITLIAFFVKQKK